LGQNGSAELVRFPTLTAVAEQLLGAACVYPTT
jgi:hypothetical protein